MAILPALQNLLSPSSKTKVIIDAGAVEHTGFSDDDVTVCSERLVEILSGDRRTVIRIDFVGYSTEPADPRDRGRVIIPVHGITAVTVTSVNETAAVPIKQELG